METAIAILIGAGCTAGVAVLIHLLSISSKWGRFEKTMEVIEKTVKRIEGSVKEHGERLTVLETRADMWRRGDLRKRSPVALTEQGTDILKKSGAEEYIEKNKESLLKQFEGVDEPFDIQTKALEVAERELQQDKKVKAYLYQEGEKNMNRITDVAGIALRDVVLKHKGINAG